MKSHTYRVIIEPDEKGTFHAFVPALPGCHSWGETIEQTRAMIRDAILSYLESLAADNKTIPEDAGMEIFETVPFSAPATTTVC